MDKEIQRIKGSKEAKGRRAEEERGGDESKEIIAQERYSQPRYVVVGNTTMKSS